MLGVVRFFADPDYEKAEYAVIVRSDLKGQGLGWAAHAAADRYAKSRGTEGASTAACSAKTPPC